MEEKLTAFDICQMCLKKYLYYPKIPFLMPSHFGALAIHAVKSLMRQSHRVPIALENIALADIHISLNGSLYVGSYDNNSMKYHPHLSKGPIRSVRRRTTPKDPTNGVYFRDGPRPRSLASLNDSSSVHIICSLQSHQGKQNYHTLRC